MDVKKDRLCKIDRSERKLRLRKDYKESIDNKTHLFDDSSNESQKVDTACTSQFVYDETILDFKSPKKIHSMQSKIINSHSLQDKSKKKRLKSKSKVINNEKKLESYKALQNRNIRHNIQQPSIESSFFKSERKEMKEDLLQDLANVKTAYVCPLCFKNFKDENLQVVHMKNCAVKNNVSIKKLMDAVELQKRQAAERKSLGLLSAPVLQDKKKPIPHRMTSHDDSDFQLAIALSKSLHEKEEIEEFDEAQIAAISCSSSLPDSNIEYLQKATLQSFGFTSSRSISPVNNWPTNKIKKKKHDKPTTLQRCTAVERERILTERIAEILMGYEDFTQKCQKEEEPNDIKEKIILKSQLLQQLHQTEDTLWDRTRLIPTQNIFYVKQLSPQITPLEKKEQKLNKEQNVANIMNQNVSNEKSLDNKQIQKIKEMQAIETEDSNEGLTISSNEIKICCKEKKFLDTLATNWRNMLNHNSTSDIIMFVKNSRHIWTHKLVFYVRCKNILFDVFVNDTEFSTAKEKICWFDVDYDVALAFLEFIYCGVINRYSKILDSDTLLSDIKSLARKYKVYDLLTYLREKEFELNVAKAKHDYNFHEEHTENVSLNVEKASNTSKLKKNIFSVSPNHMCDLKNIQCPQKLLLQEYVDDNLHSVEDSYICVKDSYILQDEKAVSMKLSEEKESEEISSKSGTPTNSETRVSLDMFDDTPDVMKYNNKSTACFEDHEDSNIHVLLSLIKQDTDIDICSQRILTRKTRSAEYLKTDKDMSICSENVGQNVMEINSDSETNSLKISTEDTHKNVLISTPQSNKPKSTQNFSSNITKQKSNLTLFIEKIQKENAKSDLNSDLDSDIECPVQIFSIRHKNPFHVDRHNAENPQFYNDEQSTDIEKKSSRLSIIEHRMRSYVNKNPEFYSYLSNECEEKVEQTNTSYMAFISPEKTMESFDNNVSNYTQNFTSPARKDTLKQVTTMPLPAVYSSHTPHTKPTNQLFNETIFDLETDEEEISMYSKYMRDHKHNSIAKYRIAIRKNESENNLSNKSISSDSINNNDINETANHEILTQSALVQIDTDVIVSDTEIENISSSISYPILQNNDSDRENIMSHFMQQSKTTENIKQDTENKRNNQSFGVEKISKTITSDLKEEEDTNRSTKSNRDKFNINDTKMISDDIDFSMIMKKKSKLSESSDNQKEESIPSPIMLSSSPEFLNVDSPLLDVEHCSKNVSETDKSRKLAKFSLNFEDDIYLANVDVDRYKKHPLEKSRSVNTLNIAEFKKDSAYKYNNKNNHENMKENNTILGDDILNYGNLDSNTMSLTQNIASIRKFKKKSLSEGQINMNRLHNQTTTSKHISMQFQYNYSQNIGNTKTAFKIIDKDVTPPPDYNGMRTPELHREMKKYGLKVQKRKRAVKLLTHIYNELHPLVPMTKIMTGQEVAEISSDEDDAPPPKKRNVDEKSLEKLINAKDSDNELLCSQDSNESINSIKHTTSIEMEFYETESSLALDNPLDITEVFTKLINVDKDLYNKILRYEPVNIEKLHCTLRAQGFKCKLSNLMSFLDEQCITFYVPEQSVRSRTRRKI